MNKKLLALAIGAAAALPVIAQAEGPTLYGKVNVTLDNAKIEMVADTFPANPGGVTAGDAVWQFNSNASRIGIKGDFDLEVGGLKALYQAEYEIDVDSGGAAPFSQRNIFAGLKGGFGTIKFGKFDDVIKVSEGKIDQFNDLAGDIDSFIAGQNRPDNIVEYTSPKFAENMTVKVASIMAEGTNVNGAAGPEKSLFSTPQFSVAYDQKDGLYAALAYGKDTAMATQTADGFTRGDIIRLAAQMKMDALEIGGIYQIASDNATASSKEDTSIMLSGGYTIDRIKLKLQFGTTEGDVSGNELTMLGLGADYKLAKASKAMLYITKLEKSAGAVTTENSVLGVGLEHSF